jgi:hypothetical protein
MKPKMCWRHEGSVALLARVDVAGGYRRRGLAESWPATWTHVEAASGADTWVAAADVETWVAAAAVQRRCRDAEVVAAGVWPVRRGGGGGFWERE